jgi:UDP-3-O-[3-hydroxymyristoyl] N-acetylglucosamine deacetylase/3-hydroxyacyl-[acyl-carrier-protein] dehydratase
VIRGESVLSKEPLRFPMNSRGTRCWISSATWRSSGRRIKGHVIAVKPGTGRIPSWRGRWQAVHEIDDAGAAFIVPKGGAVLDVNDLMRILPHRYPVPDGGPGGGVRGRYEMHGDQVGDDQRAVFPGALPGHPVMPGVLQLEAMAQVASIVLLRMAGTAGQIGYFMSADEVKFRKPVMPGDTLFIHVEMLKFRGRIAKAHGPLRGQ